MTEKLEKHWLIDEIEDKEKPEVELVGQDGNAFAIMGRIRQAWQRNRNIENRQEIIKEYLERAQSGDYNNLLAVSMQYIREPEPEEEECDDYYEDDEDDDIDDYE